MAVPSLRFDIVIWGGSLSAPAAALAAARNAPGARVLLVEPTDWLGGQATSQGVSAIDNAWFDPGRTAMAGDPDSHYAKDYLEWLRRMNEPGVPGTGLSPNGTSWVSREVFDPRSAAWVLDRMIAEQPNITLMKLTTLKRAEVRHGRIVALTLIERTPIAPYKPFDDFLSDEMADWYSTADSHRFAKVVHRVEAVDPVRGFTVIDASELGDAIVLSGAAYTQGAELMTEELDSSGQLPAMDDRASQATVFVFCMTDSEVPHAEEDLKTHWPQFDSYCAEQEASYFSLRHFTWEKVWTYRRLRTEGKLHDFDAVHRGDVSMQNWEPGNDYPYSSLLLDTASTAAQAHGDWLGAVDHDTLAGCELHAVAWYFWMKKNRPTSWDTTFPCGSHPLNMMGTRHGLARFPYVRCARRIVGPGNFRILERHWKNSESPDYDNMPSHRYYDAVGIGSYAADVHPIRNQRGLKPGFERPAPFYIPYRALLSGNVANLMACGKNMAQTFITNSAYRLHPIEWASGSAAGTAAGLLYTTNAAEGAANTPECFLRTHDALRSLQRAVRQNSPIGWKAWNDAEFPEAPFEPHVS
ncbi:FAD-dependent oxidoreductase [Candidatus Sumerlaeota bacterium]|nr:FAD-dependent oxidoreductase [Candidatus Sumerlaeota bacterium]